MEKVFIEVKSEDFLIEFEQKDCWYDGNVYPIQRWTKSNGEEGWVFYSKEGGLTESEELNKDCRIMFSFLFTWRGVWEGRIYFKDDEYWSEELSTMSSIWDKILPILKGKIKSANPNNIYDE